MSYEGCALTSEISFKIHDADGSNYLDLNEFKNAMKHGMSTMNMNMDLENIF